MTPGSMNEFRIGCGLILRILSSACSPAEFSGCASLSSMLRRNRLTLRATLRAVFLTRVRSWAFVPRMMRRPTTAVLESTCLLNRRDVIRSVPSVSLASDLITLFSSAIPVASNDASELSCVGGLTDT